MAFLVVAGPGVFYLFRRIYRKPPEYPVKTVTIPEGYTTHQIDKLLFNEGIIIEEGSIINFDVSSLKDTYWFLEGAKNLNGFLFPDTYEFFLNSSGRVVVRRFLDNFNRKAGPLLMAEKEFYEKNGKGQFNHREIIILASIIEKEIPHFEDDRNIVSGILRKRMEINMPLQVDATVCFAKDPMWCDRVTPLDLKIDSLYNTYLHYGLPPGPISNPGVSAIIAALEPKDSPYLYFISDQETKETIFARTLREHNYNINKYLRKINF